jgi:hypothetical protein
VISSANLPDGEFGRMEIPEMMAFNGFIIDGEGFIAVGSSGRIQAGQQITYFPLPADFNIANFTEVVISSAVYRENGMFVDRREAWRALIRDCDCC